MEIEDIEKIMEEYKSRLAEIKNEAEIKRQQLYIERLKEEQESIADKKLYLAYTEQIEKAQEDLENLRLEKEESKKSFEEYVKNNRQEITQKLISKQRKIENEIEEYEIKFQSQMHILKNFKYEKDKNGRVINGNEYKDIHKISENISKHLNQLKEDKIKCEEYIAEIKEPLESEKENFKTINSILNGTYDEEQERKTEQNELEYNKLTRPEISKSEDNKPKDDNQTKLDDKKDNQTIEPKDDKPNEPELTEQEKRKMVEEYLALEEKNLKAYKKLRDCLQHALEFKAQNNNKAGKMSLENARNYEKNIEKYENQLLEMAEKVDPYLNQEDINKIIEYGNNKKVIFREIREIKDKILNIGIQEQSNPKPIEKDDKKIVEEYFALLEKKLQTFKKLIKNMDNVLLYSEQNNNEIKKLYESNLSRAEDNKQNIAELTKQLSEMKEKVEQYLDQEEKEKIEKYKIQEKENDKRCKELEQEIAEKAKTVEASKKDVNNLHFYVDLKDLKETKIVIKYTLDKKEECYDVNYQVSDKWRIIRKALKNVYSEINFESEDGQQELQKYENADPNLVTVLSNNKNRLEEYIALLNGEKKIDVNDKNALKITYDIRKLSKSELSKEEKEAIEDYAFKHRDIAEVKKNALQSIKFKFREMKEKRENKKAVKALKSGKIVKSPVKDEISSEVKDTLTKAIDNKRKKEEKDKLFNEYEQNAKKQGDEFEKLTSNWRDSMKVEPRIETTAQEQETPTETTIDNKKDEKQETGNSTKPNEPKELYVLAELITKKANVEQKLNDLPKDDENRNGLKIVLKTLDEQISKIKKQQKLSKTTDEAKAMLEKVIEDKKKLEVEMASMTEEKNKEYYKETIEIMNKNIQELESIISTNMEKLGKNLPDKREDR